MDFRDILNDPSSVFFFGEYPVLISYKPSDEKVDKHQMVVDIDTGMAGVCIDITEEKEIGKVAFVRNRNHKFVAPLDRCQKLIMVPTPYLN